MTIEQFGKSIQFLKDTDRELFVELQNGKTFLIRSYYHSMDWNEDLLIVSAEGLGACNVILISSIIAIHIK